MPIPVWDKKKIVTTQGCTLYSYTVMVMFVYNLLITLCAKMKKKKNLVLSANDGVVSFVE